MHTTINSSKTFKTNGLKVKKTISESPKRIRLCLIREQTRAMFNYKGTEQVKKITKGKIHK